MTPTQPHFNRPSDGVAGDAKDARRYRVLRDMMRFVNRDGVCTMDLGEALPAPGHDYHKDWMTPRFEASVDQTVDLMELIEEAAKEKADQREANQGASDGRTEN